MIGTVRFSTGPISIVPAPAHLPRTAAEAKQLAYDLNHQARRDREAADREHAERLGGLAELAHQTRTAPGPRPVAPGIDVAAIYAERNRPHTTDGAPADVPPAGRSRTISQVAAEYWGARAIESADVLIPTSARGR